jgi:hypothetical protein
MRMQGLCDACMLAVALHNLLDAASRERSAAMGFKEVALLGSLPQVAFEDEAKARGKQDIMVAGAHTAVDEALAAIEVNVSDFDEDARGRLFRPRPDRRRVPLLQLHRRVSEWLRCAALRELIELELIDLYCSRKF